jgi:hypothetical protein
MGEPESADQAPAAADPGRELATSNAALGTGRRPRPVGDTAAMPQVQLAMSLLILFLFLLVLWMVWPFLSNS